MTEFLIIPVLALLDRLRGGWFTGDHPPKRFKALRKVRPWMWALSMGAVIGHGLDLDAVELALCAVGFVVGESIGWGGPLYRALFGEDHPDGKQHWWWPRDDGHWFALLFRGAMWAVPPVVLVSGYQVYAGTYLSTLHLIQIMSLSMWGGAQLGKHIQVFGDGPWESSELWRGALAGLLLALK